MNDRLKIIRKAIGLNQADFGQRIGVTHAAVSRLEKGERNITDQMILAVCREYNVNEEWLRTGDGEMFKEVGAVEQLAAELGLDEFAIRVLRAYQQLTPANRAVIREFICNIGVEHGIAIPFDTKAEKESNGSMVIAAYGDGLKVIDSEQAKRDLYSE